MKRRIEVKLEFEVESESSAMKDDDHAFLAGFLGGVLSHAIEKWQMPHAKITHWEWKGSKVLK